jgi:hypothetical protein
MYMFALVDETGSEIIESFKADNIIQALHSVRLWVSTRDKWFTLKCVVWTK